MASDNVSVLHSTGKSSNGAATAAAALAVESAEYAAPEPVPDRNVQEKVVAMDELLALDIENSGLKDLISVDKIRAGIKFPLEELVEATENFRADRCLGGGNFGKFYKGFLKSLDKDVTVKQLKLDEEGLEGIKKFVTEIVMLSVTDHPNIVKLLGYCMAGEKRLLVYDMVPLGLLDRHLFNLAPGQQPLDWTTRMKIAAGVAKCLEYLHNELDPPVMFRDLTPSSILLGKEQDPKLCNFGLATFGLSVNLSGQPVVRYGYVAPECPMSACLTTRSDVYCLGALLLQLIANRKVRVLEMPKPSERKKCPIPADPLLKGDYPCEGLDIAYDIGAKCMTTWPEDRPPIHEVIKVLDFLVSQKWDPPMHEEEVNMDDLLALDIEHSGFNRLIPVDKIRAGIKFPLKELVEATDNFRADRCLGEGNFGKIYKGFLKSLNKEVTVKQLKLDEEGLEGIKKFATEIVMLSIADHPNIVKLLGYSIAGEKRLLVYDIVPLGLLDHHLLNLAPDQQPLDWTTRMKIAAGMAKCLEYLHKELDSPIMFRDLNPSSILLGKEQDPKLCNFGLATFGRRTYILEESRVQYGYIAPEVARIGRMTHESDIYCLGALLLQLITCRKLYDPARKKHERGLTMWEKLKPGKRKKCPIPADPSLMGDYPREGLDLAYDIGAKCMAERPKDRPTIQEVIEVLDLISQKWDTPMPLCCFFRRNRVH